VNETFPMKQYPTFNWLVPLIALLAAIAAGAGLFWQSSGDPYSFTSLYGETVQIYGRGIYEHDTIFSVGASQGADLVALFVSLPLLIVSFVLYRRGSLRGGMLLASTLSYYLYYGASLGLVVAYNNLYLVYLALFAASFFAFIMSMMMFDLQALPARFSPRLPARGMAIFMFIIGVGMGFIWLSDVVNALNTNGVPQALGANISLITYTLDVGIIAPSALLAGALLLRRAPMGYLLTGILTILLTQIGVMVIGQTVMQLNIGVELSPGEMIGKVATWIVMGGIAVWFSISFLRNLSNSSEFGKSRKLKR
jgi:hypothetical protein